MGADKNSYRMMNLAYAPKFTTKNSHTSLPRLCSHNRPTNPRNKSQTNPKQKRNSRSKRLSLAAWLRADCLHGTGRPSAGLWWTIQK
jgi:hypothetical protein